MRSAACLLLAALLVAAQAAPDGRRQLRQAAGGVQIAVSGGKVSIRNRYRWNGSLRQSTGPSRGDPFCSAVLIKANVLLTSASCVAAGARGRPPMPAEAFLYPEVRLDAWERRGGEYTNRRVKSTIVHGKWRKGQLGNDIALLRLDVLTRLPFIALPHSLPCPAVPFATNLTVLGWGSTEQRGLPQYLQEATLGLNRLAQCKITYPNTTVFDNKQCICAGSRRSIAGVCNGDMGGPLFLKGATAGQDLLVGISSFTGPKGCGGREPSGFTNVAAYRDWIAGGMNIFFWKANVTADYKLHLNPRYDDHP